MKALEAEALEAAAALTEMAGGPRVHASCSPPSVRAPDQPLVHSFGAPQSPGQWVSPTKGTSCCTPAKRPASVQLWDGAVQRHHLSVRVLFRCASQTSVSASTGSWCVYYCTQCCCARTCRPHNPLWLPAQVSCLKPRGRLERFTVTAENIDIDTFRIIHSVSVLRVPESPGAGATSCRVVRCMHARW